MNKKTYIVYENQRLANVLEMHWTIERSKGHPTPLYCSGRSDALGAAGTLLLNGNTRVAVILDAQAPVCEIQRAESGIEFAKQFLVPTADLEDFCVIPIPTDFHPSGSPAGSRAVLNLDSAQASWPYLKTLENFLRKTQSQNGHHAKAIAPVKVPQTA